VFIELDTALNSCRFLRRSCPDALSTLVILQQRLSIRALKGFSVHDRLQHFGCLKEPRCSWTAALRVRRHLLIELTGEVVNGRDAAQFDNFLIGISFRNSELPAHESLELQHFGYFLFGQQIDL
jgi:hypothetical protein